MFYCRLGTFVSAGGASYDDKYFTIEHILPQKITGGSKWEKEWPKAEARRFWVHKIANLVPLNSKTNSKAQNYAFSTKKDKYLRGKEGASPYALTSQVLSETEWTEEIVREKQKYLMQIFSEPGNWDL